MPTPASQPSGAPPATPRPSLVDRARDTLVAAGLAAAALVAVRAAFTPIGEAVLAVTRFRDRGAIPSAALEVLGYLLVASIALGLAARRRPGPAGWLVVLAAVLGLGDYARRDYLRSIPRPWKHDFHGVLTGDANSVHVDRTQNRPVVEYRTNAFGFRGPDFTEKKPPGVVRVALIGDSFVFGMGVEAADTIKARLDERLAARGLGGRVEVLNLGLPGNNLGTHIRMYDIARRHLEADVVVIGVFIANDLAEWDAQDEAVGMTRAGWFSALCWLIGREPSVALATQLFVQHGRIERSLADLDRLLLRLDALREHDAAAPILVLPFWDSEPGVGRRFEGRENLVYLRPPVERDMYLPVDDHPGPKGTRVFADLLMTELEKTAPIRALLAAPPAAPPAP